jgi:TRAP-type C4-dicarboxylate transport system permease small subunit
MLDKIDAVLRIINKVVLMIIIVIGCAMLGICWLHIFFRYVLNNSLSWSEELLKILLVAFCMLSATIIAIRREHVSIVIFKKLFPKEIENCLDIAMQFLMFVGSIVVCVIGGKMIGSAGIRRTPVLRVPIALNYATVLVAFAIMALYELRNLIARVIEPERPAADAEEMSDF